MKTKKGKKLICLLLSIALCSFTLSACYDNNEIENLAYIIAIGIDETESDLFNLTFQTAVPKSISGGAGGGGGGEGESTNIISFKTDNFLSGFKKAGEYLNRDVNLSHTKVIVVSENIAKKGITGFLNGLQNFTDLRPNVHIIVSQEGAKEYIESIQPKLSSNPASYYDLMFKSYETEYLVPDTYIEDYLYRAKEFGIQPVTIYTAKNEDINEGGPAKREEKDKKSGEGEKKNLSIKGLAVFKNDKMVGKLNPDEAALYALLTGSLENVVIEIPDPLDARFKILSNISREKSSFTHIRIKEGKPLISIDLKLVADIQAVQSNMDYDEPDKAARLKEAYFDYLNKGFKDLLLKTTGEYRSDIYGFGDMAKRNYKTIEEWEKVKWQDIFPEAQYNVNLDVRVSRRS